MIPKHIEHKAGRDNYRALALYVADAKIRDKSEKTLMFWHEGFAENYLEGMIEVEATQAMNHRTKKEKTYHLMVSFRPEDEPKLSPEIFMDIEKTLANALGFSGHQRHCGVHKNTDNLHMHIAFNMINPKNFNRHEPYYDHQKLHKACRELEKKYGLSVDKGIENTQKNAERFTPKKNVKAETVEAQTGQQSFYNFAVSRRDVLRKALESAKNWEEVHEIFLKNGLKIEEKANGFAFKDRFGKHRIKASDMDRNFSKKHLEISFGPFSPVTKEQEKAIKSETKYSAAPLHEHSKSGELYARFQDEMERRKAALDEVKIAEKTAYKSNKNKWDAKRKIIEKYAMLPAHRAQLLLEFKAKEEAEMLENRMVLAEQRAAVRQEIPYTSWTKFLQHHAALGDETALEVLRSKKLKPELADDNPGSNEKYQAELEAKIKFKERQIAIAKAPGIGQKERRALLAVLKMEELISREADIKMEDITHRIDTKGVVIFTLKSGGTIRDIGTELHFSAHDEEARKLTEKYAKMKWGSRAQVEGNVCRFGKSQEKKQGISR